MRLLFIFIHTHTTVLYVYVYVYVLWCFARTRTRRPEISATRAVLISIAEKRRLLESPSDFPCFVNARASYNMYEVVVVVAGKRTKAISVRGKATAACSARRAAGAWCCRSFTAANINRLDGNRQGRRIQMQKLITCCAVFRVPYVLRITISYDVFRRVRRRVFPGE